MPYIKSREVSFDENNLPACSKFLRHCMKEVGKTQSWLAKQLGATENNVSMWMNGRQKVPAKHFVRIAKFFNVDPLYVRNLLNYEYFKEFDVYQLDERVRQLGSLSRNELEVIELMREVGGNRRLMTDAEKEIFKAFCRALKEETPHLTEENPGIKGLGENNKGEIKDE